MTIISLKPFYLLYCLSKVATPRKKPNNTLGNCDPQVEN